MKATKRPNRDRYWYDGLAGGLGVLALWCVCLPLVTQAADRLPYGKMQQGLSQDLSLENEGQGCSLPDFYALIPKGSLARCVEQRVVMAVRSLCVSYEWLCLEQPWSQWLSNVLDQYPGVSDIMLDAQGVTVLGQHNESSWRLQALRDGAPNTPARVVLSQIAPFQQMETVAQFGEQILDDAMLFQTLFGVSHDDDGDDTQEDNEPLKTVPRWPF